MVGISDKALLKQTNPYKFNGGTELEEDGGLNYYNTFYRKYDPQIGRFTGVDMMAEKYADLNPYQFAANNPLIYNDPGGNQLNGRATKGPDGNYHAGWFSDFLFDHQGLENDWENGSGGGGFGNGPYANYYYDVWNNAPNGKDTHFTLDKNGNIVYYNYANYYGSATFETTGYHGLESDVPEGVYFFQGTSTHSYETSDNDGSLSIASVIDESLDLAFTGTEVSIIAAQKAVNTLTRTSANLIDFGSFGKIAGRTLSGAGLVLTIAEGAENPNGWQNHNTADVIISGAATVATFVLEASNPVGWGVLAIEGLYFLGNEWYKSTHNNESLTESLFD
jgi:RHS repeat-associated protein